MTLDYNFTGNSDDLLVITYGALGTTLASGTRMIIRNKLGL